MRRLQQFVNICCIACQMGGRVVTPVCGEEVIVENVDKDAATVAELRVKPLSASTCMRAVLGEAVDTTMEVQAQSNFFRIISGDKAFDEVAHQAAESNLWVRSGEVEVNKVVQNLKILFCKIRISKAINALLESCWTSTTAADRSALGSST